MRAERGCLIWSWSHNHVGNIRNRNPERFQFLLYLLLQCTYLVAEQVCLRCRYFTFNSLPKILGMLGLMRSWNFVCQLMRLSNLIQAVTCKYRATIWSVLIICLFHTFVYLFFLLQNQLPRFFDALRINKVDVYLIFLFPNIEDYMLLTVSTIPFESGGSPYGTN